MKLASAIDGLFAEWSGAGAPGAVVAVTRHGQILHEAAYGLASIPHGIRLDRRSVMRIGSQTKQFTVLLALLLEAEGRLSLDDSPQRYLPWLPRWPAPVTLRQLAGNTGGLRDFLEIMTWSGVDLRAPSTRQAARDLLARHDAVNFPPDTQMLYSNTGFFLLSEIVEAVAGRSFDTLLRERITGPLGMDDTRLMALDSDLLPRLADQHERDGGGWRRAQWGFPLGGEGGMVSSLRDMLTWQAALAALPAPLTAALERMQAPRRYANGASTKYLLGLVGDRYRGLRSVGHGGTTAGSKSESMRFPDQGLGIVILGNTAELSPFTLARRIADVALGDALAPVPPGTAAALEAAAGLYRQEGGDDVFEITAAGAFVSSGGVTSIIQSAPGVFQPERAIADLEFRIDGDRLAVTWCGARRSYRRLAAAAPEGDPVGAYANPGLGLDARITAAGDGLALRLRSDRGVLHARLAWVAGDLLTIHRGDAPGWIGTLQVGDAGLVLASDRTKGLALRRVAA